MIAELPPFDFVARENLAHVLGEPVVAVPGTVREWIWSHDGRHILATRRAPLAVFDREPARTSELVLWSRADGSSRVVARIPRSVQAITSFGFVGSGPDVAFSLSPQARDEQYQVIRWSQGTGRTVVERAGPNPHEITFSQSKPMGVWTEEREVEGVRVSTTSAAGLLAQGQSFPIQVPTGFLLFPFFTFQPDLPVAFSAAPVGNPGKIQVLGLTQRGLEPVATGEVVQEGAAESKFFTVWDRALAAGGVRTPILIRREARRPDLTDRTPGAHAVIARGGFSPAISPDSMGVGYVSQGALFVRPISTMDLALAKKAVEAREQAEAVSQAKQVALALLIYATDYDDAFPPSDNWRDRVMPYIKSADMLARFDYTPPPGQITDPSGTTIGSIQTSSGTAIAYADGSVRWRPNTPARTSRLLLADRPRGAWIASSR